MRQTEMPTPDPRFLPAANVGAIGRVSVRELAEPHARQPRRRSHAARAEGGA